MSDPDLPQEVFDADPNGEPEQTANAGPEADGGPEGTVEDVFEGDEGEGSVEAVEE